MKYDALAAIMTGIVLLVMVVGFCCTNLKLSATIKANEAIATKALIACWYYDICHDDPDNPKHEAWTDKGRAKLHEWARTAAQDIPDDMLPAEVRRWAVPMEKVEEK